MECLKRATISSTNVDVTQFPLMESYVGSNATFPHSEAIVIDDDEEED